MRAPAGQELVERFRAARRDPALAVLEGFHPLKHALRFGADVIEAVSPDPAALARLVRELAPDLEAMIAERVREVPADLAARLTPAPPHTAVVALARRPPFSLAALLAEPRAAPLVLLENPVRLGNLGAAVRAAAAAGAAGVVTLGAHDPWHPEALRGGAGLQLALPVGRIEALPGGDLGGRPLVAIDPAGEPLRPGGLPARAVLAFGGERRGLSDGLLGRAERRLRIPMRDGVSSLNLATAVAVTLYAWRWSEEG